MPSSTTGTPQQVAQRRDNHPVLAQIGAGASLAREGVGPWSPDGWVMRTHPDLAERLAEAAAGTGLSPLTVQGVAVVVDPDVRIVGVALGTDAVWLRIADGPAYDRALEAGATAVAQLDDFVEVDAWTVELADWVDASAILVGRGRRARA